MPRPRWGRGVALPFAQVCGGPGCAGAHGCVHRHRRPRLLLKGQRRDRVGQYPPNAPPTAPFHAASFIAHVSTFRRPLSTGQSLVPTTTPFTCAGHRCVVPLCRCATGRWRVRCHRCGCCVRPGDSVTTAPATALLCFTAVVATAVVLWVLQRDQATACCKGDTTLLATANAWVARTDLGVSVASYVRVAWGQLLLPCKQR